MESLAKKFLIREEDLVFPEIKELLTNIERRILLLIKTRWVFIIILGIYSLFALIFYKLSGLFHIVQANYLVPTIAFMVMIAYNAWYHATYKWFSRLRGINQLQLVVDVIFVTILIHYSGGILSWVWSVYPLLIIEAAFLLEDKNDTIKITLFCVFIYAGLLFLEHYGFLPSIQVPLPYEIVQDTSYKLLFLSWFAFIMFCFSFIGTYLMGIIRSEEEEMEEQVVIDELTNLYNRNYFFYRLNSEIARCQRFGYDVSVLILDLDGFKNINDNFGHLEGDALLQKVAEVFRGNMRRSEAMPAYDIDVPCRYGGDEFCIILPETDSGSAMIAAERIRDAVAFEGSKFLEERHKNNIEPDKQQLLHLTLSVGVATYPVHSDNMEKLIKKADEALYQAKAAGKDKVVVAEENKQA